MLQAQESAPMGQVLSQPQVVTGIWADKNSQGGSLQKKAPTPNALAEKSAFD